ncbi:hypothetical protein SAMN05216474_1121 [Lishizhenia tianjinensis]|uniref:Uncharacterized protein n=1 Tax=Lishizhenia tianjinensis TaxID=477690 RepID=A0A1I6YRS2_9FLAO|nr:hypothetical protein [Lishizhenia tianjinensis]SFT53152.1 hypothetical protein SAMN05216474_1121 [Lishizhenia tianjinensis]
MKTFMYKALALTAMFTFLAGVASAGDHEKNPLYRSCPRAIAIPIEKPAPDAIIKNYPVKKVDRNLATEHLPLQVRKMEKLVR